MAVQSVSFSDKLSAYLKAAYVPNPDAQQAGETIRSIAKWWMEFMRNLLISATLFFLADKSESAALTIFSVITLIALVLYVASYTHHARLNLFPFVKEPRAHRWINIMAWALVYGAMYWGAFQVFSSAYLTLTKIAGR